MDSETLDLSGKLSERFGDELNIRRVIGWRRSGGYIYRGRPRRLTRWYAKQRRKGKG
jgi:hypothetical protein